MIDQNESAISQIRPVCLKPFEEGWVPPSMSEIQAVVHQAEIKNNTTLSGASLGKFLGVSGRTIRRWIGGEPIPYAAWALLCDAAGLGKIWFPQSWNNCQ